jgi:outer membrane protein OmpA-like peptidoglycan-associated protein
MKRVKYIFIALLSLSFCFANAQKKELKKASKDYGQFSYVKASKDLLELANEGHKSAELYQKLGDSYYFNNKMKDATKWYGELMKINDSINPEYYYKYAKALKGIENYKESDKWMGKFYDQKPSDLRGKAFVNATNYLTIINEASDESIEIKNLDINSKFSDFGTTIHNNKLVFASSRGEGKLYKWNEQPFLNLYTAEKQSDGNYITTSLFNQDVNTKYHESSVAFTPNDSILFFTRNNYYKKEYKEDELGVNRLKLFRLRLSSENNWSKVESIHFNSNAYSVAHPTINADGTKLYFASDMAGTTGKSDIYVVSINAGGTLGTPKNLGIIVNTEGSETFPFINTEGDLYFSSDGYPGLGGLDIYVIRGFESNITGYFEIENIGKPFNSAQDDLGYYEDLETKEGFFTSNREGGKGDDDIYSFTVQECKQFVTGVVKDEDTQELLVGGVVTLFDTKGNKVATKIVGDDASYSFELECEYEYLIMAKKESYLDNDKLLTTSNKSEEQQLDLLLEPEVKAAAVGTDLFKLLGLNPIYFDYDKSFIRSDAERELAKVIKYLKEFPSVKIDVKSHTDSRGKDAYNLSLSKRRNTSTINHIVNSGSISKDRITGKGYGETQLINKCSSGVKCSKEEHQANRRSEFIVVAN